MSEDRGNPASSPRRRPVLVIVAGLVGAALVLSPHARWEDTQVSSWSVGVDDPLTLVVEVESDADVSGTNVSEVRARVAEVDDMVRVTAWVKRVQTDLPTTGVGMSVPVHLRLKSPLDGRPVVDQNGRPIREKPSP